MSILQQFNYQGTPLRTVVNDGEPWFVAADVARILGYRDAYNLTRRLDADEKGTRSVSTPSGEQEMTVISEPGLFAAVLGSQIDEAKAFKRWVTHEVLPQIRKTGTYGQPPAPDLSSLAPESLTYLSGVGRALEAAITLAKKNQAYLHIATMTIGDLFILAAAHGLMPSELLDGKFCLRRAASKDEG